jgi:hypothetical protein
LPPDEVRNRTTQTNPIGFVRAADAAQDDSLEIDFGGGSWFAFWRHPFVRRAAVTLGLGAVIGVPPAVLGVLWARYYRAAPSASPAVAQTLSAPPNSRPLNAEPRGLASVGRPAVAGSGPRADGTTVGGAGSAKPELGTAPATAATADPSDGPARAVKSEPSQRVPRARPKAPSTAFTTFVANDGERRLDLKRLAPPAATADPPKPFLPPSGL